MKIAFWFKSGRRKRLHGNGPRDFFYGYHYFQENYNAELVEDVDLPEIGSWCGIPRLLFGVLNRIFRLNTGYLVRLLIAENRYKMDQYDWIIAVTTTHVLAFGVMQRLGVFHGKLLAVTTGLVENFEKEWQWKMARWILAKAHLVSLSRGEAKEVGRLLDKPVEFLRFGVDEFFWTPREEKQKPEWPPYVLSVGNDRHRDFQLLIEVWRPEWPQLKILTTIRLDLLGKKNIEHLRADWHEAAISDEALRELYRDSMFVVVPLKDVWQPSGQSVTTQAMGCGKVVVLALTKGAWDRHVMRHDENCIFYHAEDKSCLESSLGLMLVINKDVEEVKERAHLAAQGIYNIHEWSLDLEKYMRLKGNGRLKAVGRSGEVDQALRLP